VTSKEKSEKLKSYGILVLMLLFVMAEQWGVRDEAIGKGRAAWSQNGG
jgi:hypothetical protein